jgi:hypothetical protein
MSGWLIAYFTIGIVSMQNWMLFAVAIIAVGMIVTWWADRQ